MVMGNRMFIITDAKSYDLILKSSGDLSFIEFHDEVRHNFLGK